MAALGILLLSVDRCPARSTPDSTGRESRTTSDLTLTALPPLEEVLDAAVDHSPLLKQQEAEIRLDEYQVNRERQAWTRALRVGGSYQYGQFGNITLDQLNQGYSIHVSLGISLYELMGRDNRINMIQEELESSRQRKEFLKKEVKTRIIEFYHAARLARRLLLIHSQAKNSAQLNQQMAEKEFIEGETPLSDMARITEIATKATIDFETAKSDYQMKLKQLENWVGIPLSTIH